MQGLNAVENPAKKAKLHTDPACRKLEKAREKHNMKPPCNNCKRKCSDKIPHERRRAIHDQFWEMPYEAQRQWLFDHIQVTETKKPGTNLQEFYDRNHTRLYRFSDETGHQHMVCKKFFLFTLGYTSDKVITVKLNSATPGEISLQRDDMRGRHDPKHKLSAKNQTLISDYINSFNTCISHYRREHALQRKYLPPELSIKEMYHDFQKSHPGVAGYDTYRKTVNSLNINFAKLGEDECELCLIYEKHEHDNEDTSKCAAWKEHNENA
ncbi:uncharacterized protein LOC129709606 [Leucoraja erinacea]|uniref:uncharacterized protein LOC129709606 n=1 Tax=Leucoraja erinaceus TaxID=7782 RepID=UPI0024559DEB|nr:uncharacterized protein LOC129709606 [Leucoraja erinacea]